MNFKINELSNLESIIRSTKISKVRFLQDLLDIEIYLFSKRKNHELEDEDEQNIKKTKEPKKIEPD